MTASRSNDWETPHEDPERRTRRHVLADVAIGTATGTLAGMAGVVYSLGGYAAFGPAPEHFLWVIAAAGGFAYAFAPTLRRSVLVLFVGFLVGAVVVVATFVAPAYVLPYRQAFRDLLVPRLVGDALSVLLLVYSPPLLGAYLLTTSAAALRE